MINTASHVVNNKRETTIQLQLRHSSIPVPKVQLRHATIPAPVTKAFRACIAPEVLKPCGDRR
eukprot:10942434-Heterocapsa_arctica.AAC.1